jgi:hypothetical protein
MFVITTSTCVAVVVSCPVYFEEFVFKPAGLKKTLFVVGGLFSRYHFLCFV